LGTFHTAWGAALVIIGVVILLVIGELLKIVMRIRRTSTKTPVP
jgi:hypothetical protein